MSAEIASLPDPSPPRRSGFLAFLRAHPILCLALLTPGIPEYLSGSSSLADLVLNPAWFFLAIAINVGQYTSGALLIREAALRWGKGWGSIFLLAGAYGVTEEGLGDNTLFNPKGASGVLGVYGHFLGVNWVWSCGVLAYHVIFSIGLPILLLGLALPETRGRSLLSRRGIVVCFAALAGSTALETTIVWGVYHFWMGTPILVGALLTVVLLSWAAYRAPQDLWAPRSALPMLSSAQVFAVGASVFLVGTIIEYGSAATPGAPPALAVVGVVLVFAGALEILRRGIGRTENEHLLVVLAYGFILYLSLFGLLVSLTILLPTTIPVIVLVIVSLERMRAKYPAVSPAVR